VLGLHPGGVLRVRASNDEGRPVAGVSLWIEAQDESGTVRGRAGETDARGECVFTALRSGCYAISAVQPSTGGEIRREVDLGRGAQEIVDLRMTLAGLRLRLAGSGVDFVHTYIVCRLRLRGLTDPGSRCTFHPIRPPELFSGYNHGMKGTVSHAAARPFSTAARQPEKLGRSSWPVAADNRSKAQRETAARVRGGTARSPWLSL